MGLLKYRFFLKELQKSHCIYAIQFYTEHQPCIQPRTKHCSKTKCAQYCKRKENEAQLLLELMFLKAGKSF